MLFRSQYLAVLFPNLILREESLAENIESNSNKNNNYKKNIILIELSLELS